MSRIPPDGIRLQATEGHPPATRPSPADDDHDPLTRAEVTEADTQLRSAVTRYEGLVRRGLRHALSNPAAVEDHASLFAFLSDNLREASDRIERALEESRDGFSQLMDGSDGSGS